MDCYVSIMSLCVHISGVFIGLGLSGVIPAMHYVITNGFYDAIYEAALGWLSLMAILYIIGAVIYAARIPERIWPGRFDIWVPMPYICRMIVEQFSSCLYKIKNVLVTR